MNDIVQTASARPRFTSMLLIGCFAIALFGMSALPTAALAQGKTGDKPAEKAAEPSGPPTAKSHPNDPMLWDVESMMEDAVQQITRRYNLTPKQEEYTRAFLKKRVRSFLDQYETDVRELLQESINIRLGKTTDPGALADWAERAMPIYAAATQAILDGNNEWGVILDEKQKETHENDLRLMNSNFANVNRTLTGWAEGKGRMPNSEPSNNQGVGTVPQGGARVGRQDIEDAWIAYVNQFINVYNLDEAKKIAAREKIHKEQIDKAKLIREARKDKFQSIENDRRRLGGLKGPERAKKRSELLRRKRELEAPIYSLFVDMSRRLDALPTSKQRAEATPEAKKALEALYKKLSGEGRKSSDDDEKDDDKGDVKDDLEATEVPKPTPVKSEPPASQPAEPKATDEKKPADSDGPKKAD